MANQKLTKGSVLSGEAYYASVHRPRITEYKPDGEYVINVVLDKENKSKAEELGLRIRTDDKGNIPGEFVTLTQRPFFGDDPVNITVMDSEKLPVDSNTLIGNGSKVNVLFDTVSFNTNGNKGINGYLKTVQVIDLIPYNPDGLEVVPGGFVAPKEEVVDTEEVAFAS